MAGNGTNADLPDASQSSPSSAAANSNISGGIDQITSDIQEKLHLSAGKDKLPVLAAPDLDSLVEYIKHLQCPKIITLVGAGISTAAGIPDFRSPETGLYNNLQKYQLPFPEAIFAVEYFVRNPQPFFTLAKELYPGELKPTKSHYFIRLLAEKNWLLRHFTQNIDTLERIAGIDAEKIVEAHGTFNSGHCLKCAAAYSKDWLKDHIFRDEIPKCMKCAGVVKPDIVFFGEDLPQRYYDCLSDFADCNLLIVMGSSLKVHPFAELVHEVSPSTPRLVINNEKIIMDFDERENVRDIFMLGDCDGQCQLLAEKLGWGDELRDLVKSEHDKFDGKAAYVGDEK